MQSTCTAALGANFCNTSRTSVAVDSGSQVCERVLHECKQRKRVLFHNRIADGGDRLRHLSGTKGGCRIFLKARRRKMQLRSETPSR